LAEHACQVADPWYHLYARRAALPRVRPPPVAIVGSPRAANILQPGTGRHPGHGRLPGKKRPAPVRRGSSRFCLSIRACPTAGWSRRCSPRDAARRRCCRSTP
jgi:hypothetical protein